MRSQSKWRNWRAGWNWSWITSGALILAVVVGYLYLQSRGRDLAETACRDGYAHARTATDSTLVDYQVVGTRTAGNWNCGLLRRVGALDSRPHGR